MKLKQLLLASLCLLFTSLVFSQQEIVIEDLEFNDLIPENLYPQVPVEIIEDWNGDLVFMNFAFYPTRFAKLDFNNNYFSFLTNCALCPETTKFAIDNIDEKIVLYLDSGGTIQVKNGIVSAHPHPGSLPGTPFSFFFTSEGRLWFLEESESSGSIVKFLDTDDEWITFDQASVGAFFSDIKLLKEGPNGAIWGMKEFGLLRYENGAWVIDEQEFSSPPKFLESNQDNLFVGLENGDIWKWNGAWTEISHNLNISNCKEMKVKSNNEIWMIGGGEFSPKVWVISGNSNLEKDFDQVNGLIVPGGSSLYEYMKLVIDSQDRVIVPTFQSLVSANFGTVIFELSLEEVSSNQELNIPYSEQIKVSPNPSKGQFQIELLSKMDYADTTIEVRNAMGQLIYSKVLGIIAHQELINVDLGEVAKGWYTISLNSAQGTSSQKLLIE